MVLGAREKRNSSLHNARPRHSQWSDIHVHVHVHVCTCGVKVRVIALNHGGIKRKSRTFSHVIMPVNAHISAKKTHISYVNWREVEFAAIYTSKALTIDTHEIEREHARTRVNALMGTRPSHIVCLN